jgi:hypothetical protein
MGNISTVGVLRLRAIKPSSPDNFVRRFAQDDVFVGASAKNIPPVQVVAVLCKQMASKSFI